MKYCFGDIVVVEHEKIGVVVKDWINYHKGKKTVYHEVYVRMDNEIKEYTENEMERYMVRHKYLDEDELYYQHNAVKGE